MNVLQVVELIRSPFIIIKDGDGSKELYNSIESYHDIPFDIANMIITGIRSVNLDCGGAYNNLSVIVIDV